MLCGWGRRSGTLNTARGGSGQSGYGLVTTQMEDAPDLKAMDVGHLGAALRLWLLRHSKVPSLLSNAFITLAESLGKINEFRSKNHMSLAPVGASLRPDALTKPALVMVCTKVVRTGAPTDPANIYKMDDVEAPTRLTPKYQQAG
ncbi:hypothetical protein PAXINDRAFT_103681 [Paxillus involutus ATCC 200175]|uniref:Unplaced genomic scaffold PAXINscaffold_1477, whole genome shotgun sequence n=1 Tax=Paxillus involutus ATCC 200175 TaxID=664439 RepID=A0A0C9STV1_PAXIN|nr:hypothetical protein PAXINDRAFT_103681 [Paxillus involutus ATCC 200175]